MLLKIKLADHVVATSNTTAATSGPINCFYNNKSSANNVATTNNPVALLQMLYVNIIISCLCQQKWCIKKRFRSYNGKIWNVRFA